MKVAHTVSQLNMTADQWELFSHMPGAEACAKRLNERFTALVNAGDDRATVEREMYRFMSSPANSKLGASDTEPRYQLERLLRKVFD